jgi:integrase
MPKVAKVLSALSVKARAKKPGRHSVGGVPGLCLRVTDTLSAQWVMRTMYAGKTHDIGLGGYPIVDLQAAREEARKLYLQIRQGADVVAQREKTRAAAAEHRKAEELSRVTFEQDSRDAHKVRSQEFKNAKHAAQWISTLETYAFPVLGSMEVNAVERRDVLKVLEPIWKTKTETATRVRQRIEQVLDYSHAKGHRKSADNPARWKGGLDVLLPKPTKLKKVKHHGALPYKDMPAFMQELAKRGTMAALALEFAILTAARSGEVRLAKWSEIDLDAKLWTVPAARMKAGKSHRVPLSAAAVAVLSKLPRGTAETLLFGATHENTLTNLLKSMSHDVTAHGFRSTFKDYCREVLGTKYTDEASELALAHVSDDKTRAAYARGELLEERRKLMQQWADYLSGANEHG